LLSNACKDLHNNKPGVRLRLNEDQKRYGKNTYSIEPELIDSFTHLLGSLKLNTEFASVFVNGIFPLWSDTLLKHEAVGANIQASYFGDITPGAVKSQKKSIHDAC
jgi:hypothetical protein